MFDVELYGDWGGVLMNVLRGGWGGKKGGWVNDEAVGSRRVLENTTKHTALVIGPVMIWKQKAVVGAYFCVQRSKIETCR